jgi:hypothetical protein
MHSTLQGEADRAREASPVVHKAVLELCLAIKQSTSLPPNPAVVAQALDAAHRALLELQNYSGSLVIARSGGAQSEELEAGVSAAVAVPVRDVLARAGADHVHDAVQKALARIDLVVLVLRPGIGRDELDRLLGVLTQAGAAGDGRRDALAAARVWNAEIVTGSDLVAAPPEVSWTSTVALSRLRRQLEQSAVAVVSEADLDVARKAAFRDLVRGLGSEEVTFELLLALDLARPLGSGDAGGAVLTDLVCGLPEEPAMAAAARVAERLREGDPDPRMGALAVRLATRFVRSSHGSDNGFVRALVSEQLVAVDDLPEEVRRRGLVETWTELFVHERRKQLEAMAQAADVDELKRRLRGLSVVCQELIRRRDYETAQLLLQNLAWVHNQTPHPFKERPRLIEVAIERIASEETLGQLMAVATGTDRAERVRALRVVRGLGTRGVPLLISALRKERVASVARPIRQTIEQMGALAGPALHEEITTFRHAPTFVIQVLKAIAAIGYTPAARAVIRHLEHGEAQVREAAVMASVRLLRDAAMPMLSARLDAEKDRRVLSRVIDAMVAHRSRHPELLIAVAHVLGDPNLDQHADGLGSSALAAVRAIGNFAISADPGDTIEQLLVERVEVSRKRLRLRRSKATLDPAHQIAFIEALGAIGGEGCIPALERASDSSHDGVADAADAALEKVEARLRGATSDLRRVPIAL